MISTLKTLFKVFYSMDFNSKFLDRKHSAGYTQCMDNNNSLALDLLDKLDRISAILTVTSEMDGLDKAVARTLSHVTVDLLPEVETSVKKLMQDSNVPEL